MYPHEKGQPYEDVPVKRDDARRLPSVRSRFAGLFFVSLILSAIFRVSQHCIHASPKSPPTPLTIEGRVKNILSTTPLIGE